MMRLISRNSVDGGSPTVVHGYMALVRDGQTAERFAGVYVTALEASDAAHKASKGGWWRVVQVLVRVSAVVGSVTGAAEVTEGRG